MSNNLNGLMAEAKLIYAYITANVVTAWHFLNSHSHYFLAAKYNSHPTDVKRCSQDFRFRVEPNA